MSLQTSRSIEGHQIVARPLAPGHWIASCQCGGNLVIYEGAQGLIGRCQGDCGKEDRKKIEEAAWQIK